jgi:protein-S-isoprenylcysteine O-methyltransferase Ste14
MSVADLFARWRVRLGYLVTVVVLILARPTPQSILVGGLVGLAGLAMRALAAGFLHKQEVLTTTGPYAYTRNPLYFGSSLLALGTAIAVRSWVSGLLLLAYFTLVYSFVMRREEGELRLKHGVAFDGYANSVPLFFPRFTPRVQPASSDGTFSWEQYRRNHEQQAAIGFVLLLVGLVIIWYVRTLGRN